MKYVLMFVETEEFAERFRTMSPAERGQAFARVDRWLAEYADKIGNGAKLASPETATTVRLDGAEPIITDGPFVEGKEIVSGFLEIEVADLDEALRMVRDWPGCPIVEIRPPEAMER
ncbi:YciI family protein [Actinopolymorpha alba]|uniref:YciI family protein n=1 Tax=Actinopolymorpha alba TaxID=533267 RepID=UPI00036A426F|nr:YciI family protein [Actinopolymorpha alba]